MRKMKVLPFLILSCFAASLAADELPSCQFGYEDQFLPVQTSSDVENSDVDVKADQAQLLETGTSIFSGNVEVTRAGQKMESERATYNKNTGAVTANGDVRIRDSEMIVDADRAEWSVEHDEGKVLDAEYHLRQSHARGEASHLLRQGKQKTYMKNASYTTCPEGSSAWRLDATKVYLDHESAVGEARDVVLRVGDWPVFYTPYISFPLNDERKSGFLVPTIGNSTRTGFDLITPYYWNIAPNLDATIVPRYMSDRGLMLGGQFRYLFDGANGELEAKYLNSDQLKLDGSTVNPNYDQARKFFSWQHQSQFNSHWSGRVDYSYASDRQYFEDFGSSLNLTSRSYLNRLAETSYSQDFWNLTARVQAYQSLGTVGEQYKRLPQLVFSANLPDQVMGLNYALNAEYVEFDHSTLVDGQRINFEPEVSLPMGTASFFVTPRVALSYTQYSLQNDLTKQYDDAATRILPIMSVDSGLFFERDTSFFGDSYIQTIEPRAFYLYVPYRNQSDMPVFDSAESTFNMIRLFSYDRFTGSDRIGDANQLSLAVTSRIIDAETGKENLSLTVGQIQYFSDRKVTLPGYSIETQSHSDMVAEAIAYIGNNWSATGEIQWDPNGPQSDMSSVGLKYRGEDGGILNVSHRYRRANVVNNNVGLEQVDVSGLWPVAKSWKVFGRWYRSIDQGRTLEGLAGVQYDSCCWATRFAVRNYVNSVTDNNRNFGIFLQFELKGLGKFGNQSDSLLEKSIRGFETN